MNIKKLFFKFLKNLNLFKKKKKNNVRKVYFGLRIRFLGLLCAVMVFIIFILTFVMYLNQRKTLENEKNAKAGALTQILSGPAEFYLDRDITTTKEDIRIKYQTIQREAYNFKKYNEDIVKIMLADEKESIRFSTVRSDINKIFDFAYFKRCLKQKEEKLGFYNFKIKKKGKKTERYRAITYPIFLHKGNVVDVLNDFNLYYKKFHKSNRPIKNKIYRKLWWKYKNILNSDFNPNANPQSKGIPNEVIKAWDIDFLFLRLFSNIMNNRRGWIKKGESWMWKHKWLFDLKQKKLNAYINDKSKEADQINDKIIKRINYLNSQTQDSRLLGALAILFNVNKIKTDLNKNIKIVMYIALIMLLISAVIILFVVNFMIKNLKKLEKWGLTVSNGNIDTKIKIETNDEIGRLSDIFNNMLNDLKTKFHLEKFVSKSTRSMINKKKDTSTSIKLGRTGKKNLAFIFSDIRGFTAFSEKNEPETVIEILNLYLDLQAKIIKSKKGDIDDYVGDEIMAHFGGEQKADTTIETALQIMREILKLNDKRKKKNLPFFEIGIGIHGGDVVVGNIGSGFRMDFSCIGDAVNLSSRLCSSAKPGEILVSLDLFLQAKRKYKIENIPPISVKGKSKKIRVIKVLV